MMARQPGTRWHALSLGMLLAAGCAALLVLLAGCGEATISGGAPGTQPTATRTPAGGTVHWQPAMGAGGVVGGGPQVVSPLDGNTGYSCTGSGTKAAPGNLHVWATHNLSAPNGGATWTSLADLPIAENQTNGCTIVLDATDPAALAAMTPSSGQEFGEVSFASFDSGKTWRQLAQHPVLFTGPIYSYQGKIYGIVAMSYAQEYVNPNPAALRVSSDHMQTWQELPNTAGYDAFWLDPGTGQLLAHQFNSGEFATSDDGGQTWQPFANPRSFGAGGYRVRVPVAGQPWIICGVVTPQAPSVGQGPIDSAECTSDLGKTYTPLPVLPDVPAGTSNPAGQMQVDGVTSDGAVLATLATNAAPVPAIDPGYKLWRLPPGGSTWHSLGVPPQFAISYAPGALFAVSATGITMCSTCPQDQQEDDFVAAYP
jgi:hypothetical protein